VDLVEFKQLYQQFQLADELILQGGRDVILNFDSAGQERCHTQLAVSINFFLG
jgi:hypothetical protein